MRKTIAKIKEHFHTVVGFDVHIKGDDSTRLEVQLDAIKKSWWSSGAEQSLLKVFRQEDIENFKISALLGTKSRNGRRKKATADMTLLEVRATYRDPATVALEAVKAKQKLGKAQKELKGTTERARHLLNVLQEVERPIDIPQAFEVAFDKERRLLHEEVVKYCENVLKSKYSPDEYFAALLRRISLLEKEKEALETQLGEQKKLS